jgi:hypothetical protein
MARSNYDDPLDELIARCAHYETLPVPIGAAAGTVGAKSILSNYKFDNRKVWAFMSTMFLSGEDATLVQPFLKKQDGRGAYMALKNYHLGPNNTNNMARKTESELFRLKYTGEKRRYTFDTYVKGHIRCHTVMSDLKKYGYAGIDEQTKVRRLMEGIHNRQLDSVKTRIMSEPQLQNDFNRCVMLYKDFISQNQEPGGIEETAASIGAVTNDMKRKSKGGNGGYINHDTTDVDVELRHYSMADYQKLTNPQKLKLKRWREGKKGGNTPTRKKAASTKAAKPTNRTNGALVKQVSYGKKGGDDEDMAQD